MHSANLAVVGEILMPYGQFENSPQAPLSRALQLWWKLAVALEKEFTGI